MEKYPLIKIPNGLINPSLKNKKPEKPQKPTPPNKPKESGVISSLLTFFVAFFIMVFLSTNTGDSMVGFVAGVSIFLFIFFGRIYLKDQEKKEYVRKSKEYSKQLEDYQKKNIQYTKRLRDYKINQARLSEDKNFEQELFLERQLEYLKYANEPEVNTDNIVEGVSEPYFYEYLKDYFDSKIYPNLILPNRTGGRHFYPDFVYWDKEKNLLIDIEIDEPYIGKTGQPIHYSATDHQRNKKFIRNRWVVIRFTEKQIIKYPKRCCRVIKDVVAKVFGKNNINALDTSFLPKEKRWSKEKARNMANNEYRNSYLPKELQIKVKKEEIHTSPTTQTDEFNDDLPF